MTKEQMIRSIASLSQDGNYCCPPLCAVDIALLEDELNSMSYAEIQAQYKADVELVETIDMLDKSMRRMKLQQELVAMKVGAARIAIS